jgi:hypothetical protein
MVNSGCRVPLINRRGAKTLRITSRLCFLAGIKVSATLFYSISKMKKSFLSFLTLFLVVSLFAGNVTKTFYFSSYSVKEIGTYKTFNFGNTTLSGIPGEPVLPYQTVSLLLPPGEKAVSMSITGSEEITVPGSMQLYPQQPPRPISQGPSNEFLKNNQVYASTGRYPAKATGHLMNQYLNGFAFALSSFTPVQYNPAAGTISFYKKVTVTIETKSDENSDAALKNLSSSTKAISRVKGLAQNPEAIQQYTPMKSTQSAYQMLIIGPASFQNGFQPLVDLYNGKGVLTHFVTTAAIYASTPGIDNQDKIRNYILAEYQTNGIDYVILGGNPQHVPFRGFYCHVISGSGYDDWNIPSDLYFSGMDGNYDANGNQVYGETGDEPDVLPEVAVSRFTVDNTTELQNMVHKSVSYQTTPVLGELTRPLLVGEFLYANPVTEGGDYLDLLVNDRTDHGYFTHGITESNNTVERLYDSLDVTSWTVTQLLARINSGKQFIHHSGHSNYNYMMRLMDYDVTNSNFYNVNGIDHNYTLMYSHGCMCGGFDDPNCIAKKAVTIQNFLVAGIFNSRYGWFNEGTTDGPSQHLHREFLSALYNDTTPEKHLGTAHMISKIKTAPYLSLPGEWEPGAQRWCFYDCNAFGDAAMEIWTDEPTPAAIGKNSPGIHFSVSPNPAKDQIKVTISVATLSDIKIQLYTTLGQPVGAATSLVAQPTGTCTATLSVDGLPQGVYYCKVESGSASSSKKIMVVK